MNFVEWSPYGLALMAAVLMGAGWLARRQIGARWLVLVFELLLATVLLKQLNKVAHSIGFDLFSDEASTVISWIVVLTLTWFFTQAWRRRREIRKVEPQWRAREEHLEALRASSERRGHSWDLSMRATGHSRAGVARADAVQPPPSLARLPVEEHER